MRPICRILRCISVSEGLVIEILKGVVIATSSSSFTQVSLGTLGWYLHYRRLVGRASMAPCLKEKHSNLIAAIYSLATSIDRALAPMVTPSIRNTWGGERLEKWDLPSYSSGVQIDKIDHDTGTRDSILVNIPKSCGETHGTGITTCQFLSVQHHYANIEQII